MARSFADVVAIKVEIDESETESEPERLSSQFYAKRVRHNNIIAPWQPCDKLNSDEKKCTIRYAADGKEKVISTFDIARNIIPLQDDIKTIGTRVIAKHRKPYLPYVMNQSKRINLIASRNDEFYPGIIAREYSADDKYCVFFDDGVVQMVERQHIRCVEDNTIDHVHLNARTYFKFYVSQIQYEIKARAQLKFGVEIDGLVRMAKAVQFDRILALIHFEEINRFEWIYLGSPRISQIFRMYIKEKKLDNIIAFRTYTPCRTADVIMVDPCEQLNDRCEDDAMHPSESIPRVNHSNDRAIKEHDCSHDCVRSEDSVKLKKIGLFRRPILCGWERHSRFYQTPCGRHLHSYQEIDEYLVETESKLRIDCFDLSRNIDPSKNYGQTIKSIDISRGAERVPIEVSHKMTLDEQSFNYITNYNFDFVDVELESNLQREGCGCTDNCHNKAKCSCWQLTVQRMRKKDDLNVKYKNTGYKNKRLENIIWSGIVECGTNCKCCMDKCVNRVVQHGLQHELELFKTTNRGWGVRTKTDLPAGMFICNYAGDVLDSSKADKRSTTYQFKVPRLNGDDSSDGRDNGFNEEPKPKKYKYPNSYDVVQVMVNYFPPIPGYNTNDYPESEIVGAKGESGYVIDALNHGNIARFFNHSCDPNLFVQGVYVGDDERFPEIAFFTRIPIKAGEELTFDYRYDLIEGNATACLCGTDKCRNRLT